jgi:hypothetical protein
MRMCLFSEHLDRDIYVDDYDKTKAGLFSARGSARLREVDDLLERLPFTQSGCGV